MANTEIIQCAKCSTKLRIPSDKGELHITCPKCGHNFNYKPRTAGRDTNSVGASVSNSGSSIRQMNFADELKKKSDAANAPIKPNFDYNTDDAASDWVKRIKVLCANSAAKGKRKISGYVYRANPGYDIEPYDCLFETRSSYAESVGMEFMNNSWRKPSKKGIHDDEVDRKVNAELAKCGFKKYKFVGCYVSIGFMKKNYTHYIEVEW